MKSLRIPGWSATLAAAWTLASCNVCVPPAMAEAPPAPVPGPASAADSTSAGPAPAGPAATTGSAAAATRFVLERWEFRGDRLLDPDDLETRLVAAPGDSLDLPAVRAAADTVRAVLAAAGWWAASVEPVVEGGVVALEVRAGEPVVVGRIDVNGNRTLTTEEILSRLDLRPGEPFRESVFRADVARVLRDYSERGYARARIYPGGFRRLDDGRLGFTLRVGEGPDTEIESVRVFGNETTLDEVVARIGGVRPGDRWDVRRVEGMASRLRREGLFLSVGEPRVVRGTRDNRIGIELQVEEGPANSLFGVLGYNPRPGGGGDVVGQIDFQLRNIVGTARRAAFRFERQSPEVRDLSFRYREPWLLGTALSIEVGAAQALRDSLYSRTDLDLGITVPLGDRSVVALRAERRSSSFDDLTGQGVEEVSTGGSASLSLDARDRRLNPSRGWAAAALLGARETEDGILRSRLEADGQVLRSLGRRWVLSEEAAFRGVQATEGTPPSYDQYFLGGTNSLRGYREEQFRGDRVWWARSELRYRLSVRSRTYVFSDVGGFRRSADETGSGDSDVLVGGGIGISLETRGSGMVRFELALGRGDGFSDAKVHAGLEQEF